MDNLINKAEVLSTFNISSATLDNWIRTSIPHAFVENLYHQKTIADFIHSTEKLNKRANKKQNKSIEVSVDLIAYLKNTSWLPSFIQYLENHSDISSVGTEIITLIEARNNNLSTSPLENIIPTDDYYAYGVGYQVVLSSGKKSETGAYYTPPPIVRNAVKQLVSENKTYLEPCAGVGFFVVEYILEYYRQFSHWPENLIFANEIDPIATKICEETIRLATNHQLLNFTVSQGDGLDLSYHNIDIIITNPPYGIKNKYANLKSTEIFTHFIHKSLEEYLGNNGVLHFILPISVLSVEKHKEIRKYILIEHSIRQVENYGKGFADVFSDIISLEIVKNKPHPTHSISIIDNGMKHLQQSSLLNDSYIITLTDDSESQFIADLYSKEHFLLKDCSFALGIVTGNNKEFLSSTKVPNSKPILSGKEISPGIIQYENSQYILDDISKYQQHPPMNIFENKKIVYKFISKYIISAVDTEGSLTLNSANLIVLKYTPPNISEEYISAILNSDIMQKIFQVKFGFPIKVLKKHLQELPIFIFSPEQMTSIELNYKNAKHKENNSLINQLLNIT